jgi:Lon protease-like protein
LPEARYNILIQGVPRVRLLDELADPGPYRRFRVEVVPRATDNALQAAQRELVLLYSSMMGLGGVLRGTDEELLEVLRATADPIALVDILCAVLVSDLGVQQQLLATCEWSSRLRTLLSCLAEAMARVCRENAAHVLT